MGKKQGRKCNRLESKNNEEAYSNSDESINEFDDFGMIFNFIDRSNDVRSSKQIAIEIAITSSFYRPDYDDSKQRKKKNKKERGPRLSSLFPTCQRYLRFHTVPTRGDIFSIKQSSDRNCDGIDIDKTDSSRDDKTRKKKKKKTRSKNEEENEEEGYQRINFCLYQRIGQVSGVDIIKPRRVNRPSIDGRRRRIRRGETARDTTRSEGNRIFTMIPRVDRGVESTPSDKRTLLLALHNEETAPGSRAAFDLSLRPDRAWQGGSSRQKIYEPLGNPSMLLLILSSSVHSTVHKKNAGVECTRQRLVLKEKSLKTRRPSSSNRIDHFPRLPTSANCSPMLLTHCC